MAPLSACRSGAQGPGLISQGFSPAVWPSAQAIRRQVDRGYLSPRPPSGAPEWRGGESCQSCQPPPCHRSRFTPTASLVWFRVSSLHPQNPQLSIANSGSCENSSGSERFPEHPQTFLIFNNLTGLISGVYFERTEMRGKKGGKMIRRLPTDMKTGTELHFQAGL